VPDQALRDPALGRCQSRPSEQILHPDRFAIHLSRLCMKTFKR
jgi:hypothetical protein